jgi:type I restriction-modification system DNA methylase subunit
MLIPSLDTSGGYTSIIDGHAFEKDPAAYNTAFVTALRKLNQIQSVTSLDKTFKSRVYEQFLRRDPNATKVTGKYFTPRNIVRSIVQMAEVHKLPTNSIVCDPACGVGGFITESLLELDDKGVSNYSETAEGTITVQRKFVGLERDENIVTLAKSNFLLHTIEFFSSLSDVGRKNYSKLLSDVFIHCHEEPELGSLFHPAREKFELVMANPPYVVSGTKDTSKKIRDNKQLSLFYDGGGSGLESRFVNWIINSLLPGGRAFIILPKSMLARTEDKLKELILKKCTLDALIYLPSQCFYTTPVETYILAVTKKHDPNIKQTEPIFAYLVREIGETRDTSREPTDNDLPDMVKQFKIFMVDRNTFTPASATAKLVPVKQLNAKARWDIDYLWTTKEREELGVADQNLRSIESIIDALETTKKICIIHKRY